MLLVKTKVAQSKIQGVGLFADQFISKGTVVWRFNSVFDLEFEDYSQFPIQIRGILERYSYKAIGKYFFCADDARFTNHSSEPNTASTGVLEDVALVDIHPGDEMTIDYSIIDERFNGEF